MTEPTKVLDIEPRWPPILTVAVAFGLSLLPGRVQVLPTWGVALLAAVPVTAMIVVGVIRTERWLRIESRVIALFIAVGSLLLVLDLSDIFSKMIRPATGITGLQLLSSSIAVWSTNVLLFSVTYWWVDRGGIVARACGVRTRPDWRFPREEEDDDGSPKWRPTFVDYLFLGFCTATAFSPTEALPMTSRAKLLMMAESSISLILVLAIASRAIGLLGS